MKNARKGVFNIVGAIIDRLPKKTKSGVAFGDVWGIPKIRPAEGVPRRELESVGGSRRDTDFFERRETSPRPTNSGGKTPPLQAGRRGADLLIREGKPLPYKKRMYI